MNPLPSGGPAHRPRLLAAGALAGLALAMGAGPTEAAPVPAAADARADTARGGDDPDDYLFQPPLLRVSLHGGVFAARGRSDFFEDFIDRLTLDRGDFVGGGLGGEISLRVLDRVDVALGLFRSRSEETSEYVDFEEVVNGEAVPIQQRTSLEVTPVTLGLRFYPRSRGRAIGDFAWVPERWRPYVGGAAGFVRYELRQEGDWVDEVAGSPEEGYPIFTDTFESAEWGRALQVKGGLEVALRPRVILSAESRYQWADADLGRDFDDFEPLDLSGFQVTVGLGYAF